MAKKKGKDKEKAAKKKEDKRERQERKAAKKAKKRKDKNADPDEQDIEEIVKEFQKLDAQMDAVTVVTDCEPPSPRSNMSVNLIPAAGEMIMFGGEFFDGQNNTCYKDLYRYNIAKKTWRSITCGHGPPARCSHQSVVIRNHMYVFGGEFATAWQFYHYKDFWRLDLDTNTWEALDTANGPLPRSGHRMIVWKHFIVLFGGFYEASRGIKWYQDMFFFDLRTLKWKQAQFSALAQQPSARSGFMFVTHPTKDCAFLYGGYAKISVSTTAQRGRQFDDMWRLNLSMSGNGTWPTATWDIIPKKGNPPSRRSGAACSLYRTRMVVFGGVTDNETSNDVQGEFHNSLYTFDMERLRWFELHMRKAKSNTSRRRKGGKSGASEAGTLYSLDTTMEREFDDEHSDNEESENQMPGLNDNSFYFIIDGELVEVKAEDSDEEEDGAEGDGENPPADEQPDSDAQNLENGGDAQDQVADAAPLDNEVMAPVPPPTNTLDVVEEDAVTVVQEEGQGEETKTAPAVEPELEAPNPRIGAASIVNGNKLYVYGGIVEQGNRQTTFDDFWMLDMNQLQKWEKISDGTWRTSEWAGEDEEEEAEEEDAEEEDGSEDEEEEEDEDEEEEEADEDGDGDRRNGRSKLGVGNKIKELRQELNIMDEACTPLPGEVLRAFYARTAEYWLKDVIVRIQRRQESLLPSDSEDDEEINASVQRGNPKQNMLQGKELRRMAFSKAEDRFIELYPILQQLNELEEEQRLAEELAAQFAESHARRNRAKGKKGGKNRG